MVIPAGACRRPFGEELLSGYLDQVLTQAEDQRVRLHLEECRECRELVNEMRTVREATMTTRMEPPEDSQWDERPRGALSRVLRSVGWLLFLLWLVGLLSFAAWETLTSSEELVARLLVFGTFSGFGLLLLSVLIDRLRSAKTDRYRGVRK